MDDYVTREGPIDPEVRAYVYSLVTALGGSSTSADGRYILGDDALACLKDIKRWLKLHDQKLNRLDVTRCLAEANLVKGDLLEILGSWSEDDLDNRWKGKLALACYEVLVPLTWPMERDIANEMTRNQHRHLPYVHVAQINYKREILEHPSGDVLRKAVRLALPSMATPPSERVPRDDGIMKLMLYLVRNIAMISAPPNLPVEWNEQEVSRSATVRAFQEQDVFMVLLTMASNMGEDFKNQDVVLLEVLFHLLKGVDPNKLFMSRVDRNTALSKDLRGLMDKEDAMLRSYKKNAPSRHNRFGTMIWLKRDDERVSTISGQDVLVNEQQMLDKMDKSKKWNKPKRKKEPEKTHMNFDTPETLFEDANEQLRNFVEEFLDSGFNPLFEHLRRAIEREADRVLDMHSQQFWYLISWFLRAESARRRTKREDDKKEGVVSEFDSFSIIASVLNPETSILLNRYMQKSYDDKEWNKLDAAMRCFTQILTTIQEMADSPLDEDQEIAENLQNNIFYEEATHDRVLSILKTYKDQTFSYLDAVTELSHVFLRMLERYSKENGDLQIRSRRKARKNRKEAQKEVGQAVDDNPDQGSEAEDNAAALTVTRERKFEFNRFAAKFVTQATVDTFVKFISYYRDLSTAQLKRAHRFFYRATFKQDLGVLLYRLDIILLFNRMIKSTNQLSKNSPMYLEFEELIRQLFKRMIRKLQERPELAVELLFSKIPQTLFYLEYGYEKQTIAPTPRAPAELEVSGNLSREDQIGVVVAVLISDQKAADVDWTIKAFQRAADERKAWEAQDEAMSAEAAEQAVMEQEQQRERASSPSAQLGSPSEPVTAANQPQSRPPDIAVVTDSEERRVSMFKNNKLRLLLLLAGAERIGDREDMEAPWYIPERRDSTYLSETVECIKRHRDGPRELWGHLADPIPAAEMLKRKPASRVVADERFEDGIVKFGEDDDEDGLDAFLAGEEEHLFPAGGPTNRKSALAELAKKRRKKRRSSDASEREELDDETREARKRARALHELEKRRKIKSEEFIRDSDDESDAEADKAFFEKEREVAKRRKLRYEEALKEQREEAAKQIGKGKGKRKRAAEAESASKRVRSSDDEDPLSSIDSDADVHADLIMGGLDSDDDDLFVGQRFKRANAESTSPALSDRENASSDEDLPVPIDDDDDDTPISSQSEPQVEKLALAEVDGNRTRPPTATDGKMAVNMNMEDDEEDELPTQPRRRARATVLDDSDDE